jgi:hypothetical protein
MQGDVPEVFREFILTGFPMVRFAVVHFIITQFMKGHSRGLLQTRVLQSIYFRQNAGISKTMIV